MAALAPTANRRPPTSMQQALALLCTTATSPVCTGSDLIAKRDHATHSRRIDGQTTAQKRCYCRVGRLVFGPDGHAVVPWSARVRTSATHQLESPSAVTGIF